ncbi:hypothetical protein AVEN_223584-1 [Araneus ventricosus]|uniref:Uncharacterized protein n=1 Tax=Araneus ventricosus TaxID=182803 RepID=A0A4Y2HJK0_ARAVE|nr:hypothetical protein AVEN_223584-1 [Araneus ventricosus]
MSHANTSPPNLHTTPTEEHLVPTDLKCIMPEDTAVLRRNRISNMEPFVPKLKPCPQATSVDFQEKADPMSSSSGNCPRCLHGMPMSEERGTHCSRRGSVRHRASRRAERG